MPYGFTCKEISRIGGCAETKATQWIRPKMVGVARLLWFSPLKLLIGLVQALEEVRQEQFEEQELPELEARLEGRANLPKQRRQPVES